MNQDITTSHEDNSDIPNLSKLSKLFEILSLTTNHESN